MLRHCFRCGRKFVCQRGNRGPCHRNEVFIPQLNDSSLVITRPSCGNLVSYPWNGCMSAGKVGVAATNSVVGGGCAVRFPQRSHVLTFKCQLNYIFLCFYKDLAMDIHQIIVFTGSLSVAILSPWGISLQTC